MGDHPEEGITRLLVDWSRGEREALDALLPVVYEELHRIAERYFRRESAGHTLQPTALVNEAYVRLIDQRRVSWQNRAHFFGVAASLMRRILVDHARMRQAEKRGGGQPGITLQPFSGHDSPGHDSGWEEAAADVEILDLDAALVALAAFDPRQARVTELRFFCGLDVEETAAVLDISTATVKREWRVARAWLQRELRRGGEPRGTAP
jgi:RNA polymerase sigma factor (TIGR02999 family)